MTTRRPPPVQPGRLGLSWSRAILTGEPITIGTAWRRRRCKVRLDRRGELVFNTALDSAFAGGGVFDLSGDLARNGDRL